MREPIRRRRRRTVFAMVVLLVVAFAGCRGTGKGGTASGEPVHGESEASANDRDDNASRAATRWEPQLQPARAAISWQGARLKSASAAELKKLERYLRVHPRWELREETVPVSKRIRVAIRKQPNPDAASVTDPCRAEYPTSLNGYYSDFEAPEVLQTRVLVGLGAEHGFGTMPHVTRADLGAGKAELKRWVPALDQPGIESYLIIGGPQGWTIELFEQSRGDKRTFTRKALGEVISEFEKVLGWTDEEERRELKRLTCGGGPPSKMLTVSDGMQPGIYRLQGRVNPGEDGHVFARVRLMGPAPSAETKFPNELSGRAGQLLSEERVEKRSTRFTGWSDDKLDSFEYGAEVTVYEGDWEHRFRVAFELWFRPSVAGRPERKLAEVEATIAGWQQ